MSAPQEADNAVFTTTVTGNSLNSTLLQPQTPSNASEQEKTQDRFFSKLCALCCGRSSP